MDCTDEANKRKLNENPFIEPVHGQTLVDMKDVQVLNDIINQAAGHPTQTNDHGGKTDGWLKNRLADVLRMLLIDFFCDVLCWLDTQFSVF